MDRNMKQKTDKKHIALYLGGLRKGGAERVMVTLADHLYEAGWDVTFVTTYFTPPEFYPAHASWDPKTGEDIPQKEGIHRIYSDPSSNLLSENRIRNFHVRFAVLRSIWKTISPDLILSFIGINNIMAILTSAGLKIPVAVSVRANPPEEYNSKKLLIPAKILFPIAAGVILQTGPAAEFFPKAVQKKAVILPNPLNPDFIRPLWRGERDRSIISIGRLDENKNQKMLLEAFSMLRNSKDANERQVSEGWSIHLYGDGPLRETLEQQAKQEGIIDQVCFEGIVTDVADRIMKASIYVLTSYTEGMPNALMESMALGLSCIASDCPCGGAAELIRNGENGFLVPVGSAEKLKEKLYLLMSDKELAQNLGTEASKVQANYNAGTVSRKWENYLEKLLR